MSSHLRALHDTAEARRITAADSDRQVWRAWGPYLSERAWGTVRKDYSEDGSAWEYFPHDHARSRAYRWNEDGLCDANQVFCFALGLWNGAGPIVTHPDWHNLLPFHEYFHGDTGRGVGASHQTGWTGLVAKLLEQSATQPNAPASDPHVLRQAQDERVPTGVRS